MTSETWILAKSISATFCGTLVLAMSVFFALSGGNYEVYTRLISNGLIGLSTFGASALASIFWMTKKPWKRYRIQITISTEPPISHDEPRPQWQNAMASLRLALGLAWRSGIACITTSVIFASASSAALGGRNNEVLSLMTIAAYLTVIYVGILLASLWLIVKPYGKTKINLVGESVNS